MKKLMFLAVIGLLSFSASALASQCFGSRMIKHSNVELRLDNKITTYSRAKYDLPELTPRNMQHDICIEEMLGYLVNQKSMRYLLSNLKALENHGFDDWMILRQAHGLSEFLGTNHAEQQFFLYAIAVGLGFNAAFSYDDSNDDSNDDGIVVWLASEQKYSGVEYMYWDTDNYYYISVFKRHIDRDSYKTAFRDINLLGKTISLEPHDWCFSTNHRQIPESRLTILGMQTYYQQMLIELPLISNDSMSRCIDYILPFIQAQPTFTKLLNKLQTFRSLFVNDWRLQLEIQALTNRLTGSRAQQKLLHYALSIGLGMRTAYSFHETNNVHGELFFDVKQSFRASQITVDGYTFKRLFSFNPPNYDKHYLLVSTRTGLKQLDMLKGMTDYIDHQPPIVKKRTVSFVNKGVTESVTLEYNSLANDYWYTLPPLHVVDYQNAPSFFKLDNTLRRSIRNAFGSKEQCLAFDVQCHIDLLERIQSFTGNGFEYKVDFDVYGEEKHMPFYQLLDPKYRYSDCEDRAIAFSTIVNVLGYESVLIFLPGHLASGVKLDYAITGAKIVDGYYYAEATTTTGNVKLGRYQFDSDVTRIIPIT